MNFPVPSNPALAQDVDIYAAVYEFVRQYAVPLIPPANIYRGWQNYSALPPSSNEYAIISIISNTRRGTTVEEYNAPDPETDGTLSLHELVQCRVQIDCYSDDDNHARQRAQALETIARSTVGPAFFKQHNIGCNHASDVRSMSHVDGSKQYVKRCMTELYLTYWASVGLSLPWFDSVDANIKNVDVYHPPVKKE